MPCDLPELVHEALRLLRSSWEPRRVSVVDSVLRRPTAVAARAPPAGRHEPGRQRHHASPRGGRVEVRVRDEPRGTVLEWRTTARGSRRRTAPPSSSPSSRRSRRGPGWAWPSANGSSSATADRSRSDPDCPGPPGGRHRDPRPARPSPVPGKERTMNPDATASVLVVDDEGNRRFHHPDPGAPGAPCARRPVGGSRARRPGEGDLRRRPLRHPPGGWTGWRCRSGSGGLPDLPVVMITAFAAVETAVRALKDGLRLHRQALLRGGGARRRPPGAREPAPAPGERLLRTVVRGTSPTSGSGSPRPWSNSTPRRPGRLQPGDGVHQRGERDREGRSSPTTSTRSAQGPGRLRGGELRRSPRGAGGLPAVRPRRGPSRGPSPTSADTWRSPTGAPCSWTRSRT